jgi:hypothetical protein
MNRLVCFCLMLLASPVFGEVRTWNDSAGEHTFKAELIRADANSVRLKLSDDGKEYDLPVHILSRPDQDYIRAYSKSPTSHGAIPENVLRQIKEMAAAKWPNNYEMQKYTIGEQRKGYLFLQSYSNSTVPPSLLKDILSSARQKWPNNYEMQKYTIEQQVSAYNDLKNE